METMKEKWICPDAQVQVFEPQEFVANCEDIVLDLLTEITNGQTYHLKLDGGNIPDPPVVGQGYGGVLVEDTNAGLTAYYCGSNKWMVQGKIEKGHSYSEPHKHVNGEFTLDGSNGYYKCEDPDHIRLLQYSVAESTQHHHFNRVIEHNQS